MICEKIHNPSSPTHCVQMLSGRSPGIFSCCSRSRKSRQRTIAGERTLVEFVWEGFTVLTTVERYSTLFFFVSFHNKHYNRKDI